MDNGPDDVHVDDVNADDVACTLHFCGDNEFDSESVVLNDDDECGDALEQCDEPSILLASWPCNRLSNVLVVWCAAALLLTFVDTGSVDADLIICAGIVNDNSCNPRSFSNSFGSLAPGRSCLLANISIGTPCMVDDSREREKVLN